MFDFITQPIETAFTWFSYALMFGAFITTLIVVGIIVAIPLGLKLLGVYFARTLVTETAKVLRDVEINKLNAIPQDIKNSAGYVVDKIRLVK